MLNDWIGIIEERHQAELNGQQGTGRRVSAVGRLDKETSGLLLLTDDGILHERVLRPGTVSKIYEAVVKLREPMRPTADQIAQLLSGVELQDGEARASVAEVIDEWTQEAPTEKLSKGKGSKRKREEAAAAEAAEAEAAAAAEGGAAAAAGGAPATASGAATAAARGAAAAASEGCADSRPHEPSAEPTSEPTSEPKPLPRTNVFVIRLCVSMGRNRVVRRMLAAGGLPVYGLKRVQIGQLHLERDLALPTEGDSCRLSAAQELQLRRECGLAPGAAEEVQELAQ